MGLISDIGSQVADIARTQGELNALKAAKEATGETLPANATEKQRQEYLAKLRDTPEYKKEQEKYGTGSEIQLGIQAATAALQGLAGGNLAGALAGASAPELAHLLKSTEKDPAVNAIAHAILGGAVAAMQGNNVAAGAAGAATGELAARAIAGMLYPGVKQSDLSEEQKQTISTLATVSAGLAGGLTGNSTASAAVGAQSGKNAVENNALSDLTEATSQGKTPQQVAKERVEAENERYRKENCEGMSADACSAKMYSQRREALKTILSTGADFVPVVGDIKSFAEAQSALDYLVAAVGIIPGAGDVASKTIKAAETALKKGDVVEASKLINKASDELSATLPMGSRYNQMNQPKNPSYQPVRNLPATISNREYSGHALDRMQDRGITPSVIENVIKNGKSTPSRNGTTVHFEPENKVSVVTNSSGKVVTVKYGDK